MSVMTRSTVIKAPVSEVFEFAKDPGQFWATSPDVATRDVVVTPDGVGSSTHAYSHGLGLHFEGTVEYTEVVAEEKIVAKVSFWGEHPTWTFTFEPVDGGTKLTMTGEWHAKVPVVGKVIDGMEAREHAAMVEKWLEELKKHLEPATAA
jgi:uncharacterized protein YndB with AHSA1/START domain